MEEIREKSLKLNMILNTVRGIMGMVFPLITFPYVSRILGVDNIGKYNFACSVISYFVLLAGLGINAYAIREGARIRDKKEEFKHFSDEMFSINLVSAACSYILLIILLMIVPKFRQYSPLLIILSLQIMFKTIGVEWIYSIYEDYTYITVRSIIFQFLSLILLFLFVRTKNDTAMYAAITVVSGAGSNILSILHSRKYCNVRFIKDIDWERHIGPVMTLFVMSAAVTVYVSSDTTVLGFLCDDRTVGIYAVSSKVYAIVKSILSSVIVVSIPRLSALSGDSSLKRFNLAAEDIYKTLVTLLLPAVTGVVLLNKEIILLIAGSDYFQASVSLYLLAIALLFCFEAYFWGQCILVPMKRETILFKITIISAAINIALNFILIPFWKENACALTTMTAEAITCFFSRHEGRKYIRLNGITKVVGKSLIGCGAIVFITSVSKMLFADIYVYTSFSVILSVLFYFMIEIFLKNQAVSGILAVIKRESLHE